MQIPDLLTCAMTVPLATAATWAACRLQYGRRLKAMQRRLDKLNQARLLYDRHGAQVRRQLEHLKRELDLQRAQQPWVPTPPQAAGPGPAHSYPARAGGGADPEPLPADGFAPTLPMHAAQGTADGPPSLPPDGFAPTRPMPRPARPTQNAPRSTGMERLRQVG